MKRMIYISLWISCATCVMFSVIAEPVALVQDGAAEYVLVLPDEAVALHYPQEETLQYAADFLNEYINKVTGAELSVIREKDATSNARRLFLGPTKFAESHIGDLSVLKREALVLKTVGNDLIVCGRITDGVDEGTLYGVYEFCEQVLGVHWYFADDRLSWQTGAGLYVPKSETVQIPELDFRDHPAFRQHEGLINHWGIPDQLARRWHSVIRFGSVRDDKTPNHTQSTWYDVYHETHPEYFAKNGIGVPKLNKSNKNLNYICFSSDAVLQQMLKNIEAWDCGELAEDVFGVKNVHAPSPGRVYFCPNDGMIPNRGCKCSECAKRYRKDREFDGQMSEVVWDFIRRYAEAIDKKWPGRRLGVLAYSCYQQPPATIKIPDNVDVTLVFRDIMYMQDPEVWKNNIDRYETWHRLLGGQGDNLSLWFNSATLNSASYVPAMYPYTFKRMMQYLQKRGAVNFFICGYNPVLRRPCPANRRIVTASVYPFLWIQSKIVWDPSVDPDVLLRQYCGDVYGPAAESMVEFYNLLIQRWESRGASASALGRNEFMYSVKFPKEVSDRLKALLAQAESKVEPNTPPFHMVRYVSKNIFPRFFKEIDVYAKAESTKVKQSLCMVMGQPLVLDGCLDDFIWGSQKPIELHRRAWGDPSDRLTSIRILRHGKDLYVGAELKAAEGQTDFSLEEIRIQFAKILANSSDPYAPNIDKTWGEFDEVRISADGQVRLYGCALGEAAVDIREGVVTIEARISLVNVLKTEDQQILPVQFMRYWGVWNRYDTWSPAMTENVSDYPTSRFGTIVFLKSAEVTRDGLE